jgi:hypothetical protein
MHGLLWRSVQKGFLDVPGEIRHALMMESVHAEMRHTGIWDALASVVSRLGEAGIEVATFKGVAAERRWYDALGDRPCWDVDLLLAPHQLDRAREAVELIHPNHDMAATIQGLARGGHAQGITLRYRTTEIDLHFDVFKFGYTSRQPDVIWGRMDSFEMDDGTSIRMLDPELSLVHFLYHLNRDKFKRLLGYADVARVLSDETLDREFVLSFVAEEGLSTQFALALRAVTGTLGLPDEGLGIPPGWRAAIWRVAWRPRTRLLGLPAEVRFMRRGALLLPLLVHGRAIDTIHYWLHRLFPPRAAVDLKHPHTQGPYLWRLMSGRVGQRWRRTRMQIALRRHPKQSKEDETSPPGAG